MRRFEWLCLSLAALLCQGVPASAQNTLDALEQELNQVKQEHQDASSQGFDNFIGALDKAVESPDDALSLYQQAGGEMPDAAPVITRYSEETPDEKEQRLAQDQANSTTLAYVAQLHCGLMRFAAFFIKTPDKKGLHDDWAVWLKTAAQMYPQTSKTAADVEQKTDSSEDNGREKKRQGGWKRDAASDRAQELKEKTVGDSIIGKYFDFHGWDNKEQAQWKVSDLPKFYRAEILEPLRMARKPDLLAAWDVYIAMCQTDQSDQDKWAQADYPSLAFDRAADDYVLTPSTDKLSVMVDIIKANPSCPKIDDMLNRVHQMMEGYRKMKTGGPAPAMAPLTGDNAGT